MPNYDFSTLNDKDFEEIVCDLLSAEHKILYQSFKKGRDNGIDLRYSSKDNENHTIVQVKHYLNSGKSALKSKLKLEEFRKAKELNVERYIVVTSIGLSPDDKSDIKSFFEPYIQTTNDIYGKDELNTLLGKHKKIESRHFKLWFTNTNILDQIINNGVKGRSAFHVEKIKRNIGLFVKTQSFEDALDILKNEKILLVTGIPGIGKSTLSYLLMYTLLGKGYELIYCDNDIREAEDLIGGSDEKQVFFFDDFLGDTYLEVKNGKNRRINDFVLRVKASKNKLVILTTRTTILHQAQNEHEKLYRSDLDTSKFELKIDDYSKYQKARIFYNHLYFNKIPSDDIDSLLEEKRYHSIIRHDNYNPRLLEYITDIKKYKRSSFDSYYDFCIYNLNHPEEIWKLPLKNQLNDSERYLLHLLLTLGGSYELVKLERAYEETRNVDREKSGFTETYRNLLKGYLKAETRYKNNTVVNYINPSLKDYLIDYFNTEVFERKRLLEKVKYIEQIESIKSPFQGIKNGLRDWLIFVDKILTEEISSLLDYNKSECYLRLCLILKDRLYDLENGKIIEKIDEFVLIKLRNIDWDDIKWLWVSDINTLLDYGQIEKELKSNNWLINHLHLPLKRIIDRTDDLSDLESLFELQDYCEEIDIMQIIDDYDLIGDYDAAILRVYEEETESIHYSKLDDIKDDNDLRLANEELEELRNRLTDYFSESSNIILGFNPISENEVLGLIEPPGISDDIMTVVDNQNENHDSSEIEELFNRLK